MFTSQTGAPLDAAYVRRALRRITSRAKLGEGWTPRELRHSFVSIMSDNGVSIETIADLVGHGGDRDGLPAPAQAGDHQGRRDHEHIFSQHKETKSA